MKKSLRFLTIVLLLLIGLYPSEKAKAQSSDERVGFSVQAILPENQRDTGVTYFDLFVEPNQTQTIQVEIFNHQNTPIEVEVTPTTASTNQNGLIVYEPQETYDESLTYVVSDLMNLKANTVLISANDSQVVTVELEIPENPFEGFLLGGLHFEKQLSEEEGEMGVQIRNRYSYLIAVQLTQDEAQLPPNLEFVHVEPALVNYRTAVVANIQNDQPNILGNVSITGEVYEFGDDEPIKISKLEDVSFAPNSTMEFVIDWENRYLEPGDYELKLLAESGEEKWEWHESFSISNEQAQLSEQAVELEQSSWLTPQLFLIVIVLLILVILYLIYRLRKKA